LTQKPDSTGLPAVLDLFNYLNLFNIFIFIFLACELLKFQQNGQNKIEGERVPKEPLSRSDALF
jgi:hypothetical protein